MTAAIKKQLYNIWYIAGESWIRTTINGVIQDPANPVNMSYEDALDMCNRLNVVDGSIWLEVRKLDGRARKPAKAIPDIPMDPTLPTLMAGHLQDRMRKRS